MKISTKGRYGLRTLMDIATHQSAGPVNLHDIAARQKISAKYLWQILTILKTAGLVRGTRGPKGGYVLLRPPEDITLLDIVQALEGPIVLVECTSDPSFCPRESNCISRRIWSEISQTIRNALHTLTLAKILLRHADGCADGQYMI